MAITAAAQRKRKRSAAVLHAAQRKKQKAAEVLRPPPPIEIDNTNAIPAAAQRKRKRSAALLHAAQRKKQKAAEVLRPPPPIDIDNTSDIPAAAQRKRKRSAASQRVLRPPPPIDIDNTDDIPAAVQRKRKRSADAAQRRKQQKVLRPLPAIDIDNNNDIIEFEKKKADHPSIDIILCEILPRLPAKSVCRFMCVSKHWKSFLSTRVFGKMHCRLHHHMNNKSYKLLLLDKPPVDLCRKPLNHGSVTVGFNRIEQADPRFDLLLASLDGLVCVASTEIVNSLALWNPFTGAYYKLPSNPNFTRPFDSYQNPCYNARDVVGFYSDSSNDYYKVLYLVYGDGAYIYSQRLNSWRKIEFRIVNGIYDPCPFLHEYKWSRATFCDHSLYFSVKKMGVVKHQYIICFDVNTEEFRVIQYPPLPSGATSRRLANLVVIDGCIHLCAAYYIDGSVRQPFEQGSVWKLNGDGATWVEVASFPGPRFGSPVLHAKCVTRNARDTWLAISDGGRIKSILEEDGPDNYDPFEIMSLEEFTLTPREFPMYTYSRIIYDETLVSPYPPTLYGDMVGHSNDVEATVVACKL